MTTRDFAEIGVGLAGLGIALVTTIMGIQGVIQTLAYLQGGF